jgi:hypothetical protein
MEHPTRTRRALSTVLAVFLAIEAVSAVGAAAATRIVPATHSLPAVAPAGDVLAEEATSAPTLAPAGAAIPERVLTRDPRVVEPAPRPADTAPAAGSAAATTGTSAAGDTAAASSTSAARSTSVARGPVTATRDPLAKAARADAAKARAASAAKAPKPKVKKAAGTFRGMNRVWIPELGINRSLAFFPCSRTRPPDNYMYRWGCSGSNNVYIMGHAASVMRPLHDAYYSGRLHVGMKAYYADGKGRVHVFAVRWWKKTLPTTDAAWAWAPQPTSSMTLQTCVGSRGQYRLMVRLAEVGG